MTADYKWNLRFNGPNMIWRTCSDHACVAQLRSCSTLNKFSLHQNGRRPVDFFITRPDRLRGGRGRGGRCDHRGTKMLTVDIPSNKSFIERWKKWNLTPEYPYPDLFVAKAYQALMGLAAAVKKANSVGSDKVIKAWERMQWESPMGKLTMRPCDHSALTPGPVAEKPPGSSRFHKFPYVDKPLTMIAADKGAVAPKETGNPRCK